MGTNMMWTEKINKYVQCATNQLYIQRVFKYLQEINHVPACFLDAVPVAGEYGIQNLSKNARKRAAIERSDTNPSNDTQEQKNRLQAICDGFFDPHENYYIYGPVGSGKTHLMYGLVNYLFFERAVNKPSRIETPWMVIKNFTELLTEAKSQFNNDNNGGSFRDLVEDLKSCQYLFIDDIGAEKITDWSIEFLYMILNHRCNVAKHIVCTTNFDLNQLSANLDDRLASRLYAMCRQIKLNGKDRRKYNK